MDGGDSATFWDKGPGTEVPWDNGTTSKSYQRTGQAGTVCQNP